MRFRRDHFDPNLLDFSSCVKSDFLLIVPEQNYIYLQEKKWNFSFHSKHKKMYIDYNRKSVIEKNCFFDLQIKKM